MEVEQVLHMKGGEGYTSYANNSLHPRTIIAMVKPTLEETIEEVYLSTLSPKCLKMADLGCAAGPNTLLVASQVMDSVRKTCQKLDGYSQPPSLQVFLNDLPGNDFNALFRSLPGFGGNMMEELLGEGSNNFGPCFFAGVPGSFYGRLFPNDSLHFFYSSYALMWISKVPKGLVSEAGEALNKGNLCIAKTSPPEVHKAYFEQFQRDFTLFLKSRAEELVPGGGVVLTILGSMKSNDPLNIWEFIGLKLNDMVLEVCMHRNSLSILYWQLHYGFM
ncbi:SAM dependent carboxyl methyltransferase [Trema orientale]|uniref:SAM dependent carboxyl methyltransferase n=1 Tax=Trema orientale TaxID=63057 RepID=A0A2P5FKC1_TREOI|nr:SAM dependent carboxyl methyltransferase [Trema orientale]